MNTSLRYHIITTIRRWRLRMALYLFPKQGFGVCANRTTWRCDTKSYDVVLTFRKKDGEDGVTYEEMLKALDTFIGRQATQEEWKTLLSWKARP